MGTITLRPNANGDTNDWNSTESANYLAVDETIADEDATYNYTTTGLQVDLYNIEDPPSDVFGMNIDSVTVYIRVRTLNSSASAYIIFRTYGTDYTVPINVSTSYTTYSATKTNNPYTGNPWTWTEVQNLQIGIKDKILGVGDEIRITQAYAVVEYSPPPVEKVKHPYTHLDKGPHPRSRLGFYPRLGL